MFLGNSQKVAYSNNELVLAITRGFSEVSASIGFKKPYACPSKNQAVSGRVIQTYIFENLEKIKSV
jgi:hypothetical protein